MISRYRVDTVIFVLYGLLMEDAGYWVLFVCKRVAVYRGRCRCLGA